SLELLVRDLASSTQGGSGGSDARKSAASSPQATWTEYEQHAVEVARFEGKKIFHIVAQIDPLCAMPIAARQLVANALGSVAKILGVRPEPGSVTPVKTLDLLVATAESENAVIAKCRIPTVISHAHCFEVGALEATTSAGPRAESKASVGDQQREPSATDEEQSAGGNKPSGS